MNLCGSLNYLNSFFNLEKVSRYNYSRELKLERMRDLLEVFGNPQDKFNSIHIAGSKGKGTTAVAIYQILKDHGYRVGLYTSPHLLTLRERIRFSQNNTADPLGFGDIISEQELVELVKEVKPHLDDFSENSKWGRPTFFEVYTLFAFLYFAKKKVDFAVLETGLGGRLDATNICNPVVTAITKILYEHTDKLGNRIQDIAREKAGILKDKVSLVLGMQKYLEVVEVIKKKAVEKGVKVYEIGQDVEFLQKGDSFDLKIEGYEYKNLKTNLIGDFQKENLAIAVTLAYLLKNMGYKLQEEKIRKALSKIYWPGRMQVIKENPQIILDAAHIPESIQMLGEEMRSKFGSQEIITILAVSSDKDVEGVIRGADSFSDELVFTDTDNPRLSSKKELLSIAKRAGVVNCMSADFHNLADRICKDKSKIFLITGSIFLVSETFKVFKNGTL